MNKFKHFVSKYESNMTNNDLIIKQYILKNWHNSMKSKDICKEAHVSMASMSRFIKKMRLKSYKQFKNQYEFSNLYLNEKCDYDIVFNYIADFKQTLISETQKTNDSTLINQVSDILSQSDRIYFVGLGYSKNQSQAMIKRLSRIGKCAQIVNNLQDIAFLDNKNNLDEVVCFAISQTGETKEVIDLIKYFKGQHSQVITITSEPESSIHMLSDIGLIVPKVNSGMFIETLYSEVTVNYLLDCIFVKILFDNYEESLTNYNKTFDL